MDVPAGRAGEVGPLADGVARGLRRPVGLEDGLEQAVRVPPPDRRAVEAGSLRPALDLAGDRRGAYV